MPHVILVPLDTGQRKLTSIRATVEDLASTSDSDFEVEFVNDLRLSYEVRMCSVHVVFVGRDLPCARSKLTGDLPLTFSLS